MFQVCGQLSWSLWVFLHSSLQHQDYFASPNIDSPCKTALGNHQHHSDSFCFADIQPTGNDFTQDALYDVVLALAIRRANGQNAVGLRLFGPGQASRACWTMQRFGHLLDKPCPSQCHVRTHCRSTFWTTLRSFSLELTYAYGAETWRLVRIFWNFKHTLAHLAKIFALDSLDSLDSLEVTRVCDSGGRGLWDFKWRQDSRIQSFRKIWREIKEYSDAGSEQLPLKLDPSPHERCAFWYRLSSILSRRVGLHEPPSRIYLGPSRGTARPKHSTFVHCGCIASAPARPLLDLCWALEPMLHSNTTRTVLDCLEWVFEENMPTNCILDKNGAKLILRWLCPPDDHALSTYHCWRILILCILRTSPIPNSVE